MRSPMAAGGGAIIYAMRLARTPQVCLHSFVGAGAGAGAVAVLRSGLSGDGRTRLALQCPSTSSFLDFRRATPRARTKPAH